MLKKAELRGLMKEVIREQLFGDVDRDVQYDVPLQEERADKKPAKATKKAKKGVRKWTPEQREAARRRMKKMHREGKL